MEDWQEMLIIILVILIGMMAYLTYLGVHMMELRDSISEYNDMRNTIDNARGAGTSSGPATSPFDIFARGFGP